MMRFYEIDLFICADIVFSSSFISDKIQIVTGIVRPPLYSVITGHITSPNFPNGYAQNGETYTYILQNLDPYGHVRLTFDDWDVAQKSHIQVRILRISFTTNFFSCLDLLC